MSKKEELIPVGKITGPHGIRGEVKVLLFGGADDFPYKRLLTGGRGAKGDAGGGEKKAAGLAEAPPLAGVLKVKGVRRHKGLFLVLFEGFESRTAADALNGIELFIEKKDLPELPPGEFYQHDLIGLHVTTEEGRDLGIVTGIIPTGGSDVLEINGPAGEVLLPMAGDFIQSVDMARSEIKVRLIEGLLPEDK